MLRKISIISIAILLPLSCSTSPKPPLSEPNGDDRQASPSIGLSGMSDNTKTSDAHAAPDIQFNVNSRAAELLQTWFDDPTNEDITRKLTMEPGTQIMAACARAALPNEVLPEFSNELTRFKNNHELDKDPYHIRRAWQQRQDSAQLLAALKAYDFSRHVTKRVAAYIPDAQQLNLKCNLYFVLTGWKWGDAMFTGVERIGNTYELSDNGQPTVIINLALMTELLGQKEKPESVVQHVAENLVHECFHLAYAQCQSQTPARRIEQEPPELTRLVELIQNEGMAHYISHGQSERLIAEYDQTEKFKTRERQAFEQLGEAVVQLADPQVDTDKKLQLLASGTSGDYWSKFTCISGMFMAYHIEQVAGRQALRNTVEGGGPTFLKMYQQVQKTNPSLPQLPPELVSYCHRV